MLTQEEIDNWYLEDNFTDPHKEERITLTDANDDFFKNFDPLKAENIISLINHEYFYPLVKFSYEGKYYSASLKVVLDAKKMRYKCS